MTLDSWLTFVIIWPLVCLGVGPNSVCCATAGASNGFRRGIWAALGITIASLFHSLIAAFGFSALLLASANAYTVLKWLGVAYLIYLGLRLWISKPTSIEIRRDALESRSGLLKKAFLISMTNPQPILTYLAFFTPVLDPNLPLSPQLWVLIPSAMGIVFIMFSGYVLSGTPLRYIITSIPRQILLNRVTAGFYMFTAGVLASMDSSKR